MAPMAIMIGAAVVSAMGAIAKSRAEASNYEAQEKAANYNASVEKLNANAAMSAASANEQAQRRENAVKQSFDIARVGEAGGFTGTNVGALAQEGADLELSALNTRYQGAMQARGLLQQATYDEYQAKVAKANTVRAKQAGWLGAAAAAMSSASSYGAAGRGMGSGSGGGF